MGVRETFLSTTPCRGWGPPNLNQLLRFFIIIFLFDPSSYSGRIYSVKIFSLL